ncbi:MarR family transcriptional regulator [Leifsonia sp. YIM 134122]|uniref:MarR family transcriptional regulator n=1 Tax=Leifsonia stereocauli TaxID=3134136 RepID=A0ABU9W4Q0_9MICO
MVDPRPVTAPRMSAAEEAAWVRLIAVTELLPGALDAQLLRDARLTHFEYRVLMVLADSENQTSGMTRLASHTNSTLPRLSHVVRRLEDRALVERFPCPEDRRATNARLTDAGRAVFAEAGPGHIETVRDFVLDALSPEQLDQLYAISGSLLGRLDPEGRMTATSCSRAPASV